MSDTDNRAIDFTSTLLPGVEKSVCQIGIAGNYGLGSSDIVWAAEQGAAQDELYCATAGALDDRRIKLGA